MAMKSEPTPIRVEKGRALDQYKSATERLARVSLRMMGDVRHLRNAGADIYLRQAEIAALVEFLIEKKLLTTDEFLRRCADCMVKTAERLERQSSAIHLPGRG